MSRPWAALAAALGMMAGCASTAPARIYVLSSAGDAGAPSQAPVTAPEFALPTVLIPDYLDTTDIRVRIGAHEVRSSPTGRWGERLSAGITRALRADLARRLPLDDGTSARAGPNATRPILVTIDALDVFADGHCVLSASWTIVDGGGRGVSMTGRQVIAMPAATGGSTGDGEIVSRLADAVGELADSIAAAAPALAPPSNGRGAAVTPSP